MDLSIQSDQRLDPYVPKHIRKILNYIQTEYE